MPSENKDQRTMPIDIPALERLSVWLLNHGEEVLSHAHARRSDAHLLKNATAEDLRVARKLAEQMSGRRIQASPLEDHEYAEMQGRIADKLEAEGRMLCEWGTLASLLLDRMKEEQFKASPEEIIRGIVLAALELACLRHNLCLEDSPPMVVEQVAKIADDTFNAMYGIDTCAEEPCEEIMAFYRAIGRPLPPAPSVEGERKG